MKTLSVRPVKTTCFISVLTIFFYFQSCMPAFGQQNIIADKDNTHPEIGRAFSNPAFIASFTAQKWNGYNEITWTATREQDTRKYIIEYSSDGINFQAAGEVLTNSNNNSPYLLKHYTTDDRALLYRVGIETLNGKFTYSSTMFLEGTVVSPVTIYPTIVTGNMINVNSAMAVERIIIVAGNGAQVFAKDVNGQRDYIPVVIPSLGKGIYWMTFYGHGWKTTTKFIIA